jgi:imidazolonepropionase-like amidohydrolase
MRTPRKLSSPATSRPVGLSIGLAIGMLVGSNAALAQTGPDTNAPSGSFVVRCGTLLLGDGKTAIENGFLVVVDGKVRSFGKDAPPSDLPIVDASGKVVMPGIVAVDSDLAATADSDYQRTPDALALDSFDFERKWTQALSGGVTTAYVSPGRQRLISGQGAVVKLAGDDLVARVLAESQCLRVNFGEGALQAPRVFEPNPHPTDDEPLEPARIQTPTSRISVLAELRAAFAEATDKDTGPGGRGPTEHRYDERPLAAVLAKKLPLRAGAFVAHDIRRALQLQAELGLAMVLEDPQEIAAVAPMAAKQGVAATFRMPVRFGRTTPGGEDRLDKQPQGRLDAPAKAAAAGMKVGVGPAPGLPLRDYLLAVAVAVRAGLPEANALRAIGSDAAAILGVDGRVGSLAVGKDADFVVLSGGPLQVGTMVEQTWIDGKRAWQRQTTSNALAVRTGTLHDGLGRVFRNGVVLIQDGRIKSVGEDLAIPYGATILDLPGTVTTPGFVDAFSHLGLAGDGTGVPPGAANQRLHEAVMFDDPMFAPALAEGITTVLASGKDAGLVSGRITALKTGASDPEAMVVRAIAGQRFVHDAIGPDAIKPLADQLQRGKQYLEAWRKYDKDLADWQAGKLKAAAAPPPAPAAPDAAPVEDPVSGSWEAELTIQGQLTLKIVLELELAGTKVTGKVRTSFSGRELPAQDISNGTFENGTLRLEFRGAGGGGGSAVLEAAVANDRLTGKLTLPRIGEQEVSATRTSKKAGGAGKPAGGGATSDDGKPKAPRRDEALEPLRAAFLKQAAIVVRSNRGAAITDVAALLDKEELPWVLQGAEDLADNPALLKGKKPPVIVGPEAVTEEQGKLRNAAALLADQEVPLLFGSGECAAARNLPLHAAYAVRYGLSPADALVALTYAAAKAFRLDDRIGSLQRGRDADLVVFSGDPFEPQSRVLLVVCNGKVVVDHREKKQ